MQHIVKKFQAHFLQTQLLRLQKRKQVLVKTLNTLNFKKAYDKLDIAKKKSPAHKCRGYFNKLLFVYSLWQCENHQYTTVT